MKVRFFNIKWDTDGEEIPENELPTDVTHDVPESIDIFEEGANFLSDKYRFCIFSFDFVMES